MASVRNSLKIVVTTGASHAQAPISPTDVNLLFNGFANPKKP